MQKWKALPLARWQSRQWQIAWRRKSPENL
jgi:hypothetical protein